MAQKPPTREERLAQALRANLKRRKAAERAHAAKAPPAAPEAPAGRPKSAGKDH